MEIGATVEGVEKRNTSGSEVALDRAHSRDALRKGHGEWCSVAKENTEFSGGGFVQRQEATLAVLRSRGRHKDGGAAQVVPVSRDFFCGGQGVTAPHNLGRGDHT